MDYVFNTNCLFFIKLVSQYIIQQNTNTAWSNNTIFGNYQTILKGQNTLKSSTKISKVIISLGYESYVIHGWMNDSHREKNVTKI